MGDEFAGYTKDQQRAADYLVELSGGNIGGGTDPVGFLILQHRFLRQEFRELKAEPKGWQTMSSAPKEPRTGVRGPVIIGINESGVVGRTSWCWDHPKGSSVWLLYTGDGLMEWEPIMWVEDPDAQWATRTSEGPGSGNRGGVIR